MGDRARPRSAARCSRRSAATSRAPTRCSSERWQLLTALAKINEAQRKAIGQRAADYQTFYDEAYRLLNDERWPAVFKASDEDKQRYGDDEFGLGCILARNLLTADAGTRFVYVYDGDRWDHHGGIFDRTQEWNHYRTCTRLDKGLVSLMDDLAAIPGSRPGKSRCSTRR